MAADVVHYREPVPLDGVQGPQPPEIEVWVQRTYWPRFEGRYTPPEAARLLLKSQTMDEIRRAALLLGMTARQAHQERLRLYRIRYGI